MGILLSFEFGLIFCVGICCYTDWTHYSPNIAITLLDYVSVTSVFTNGIK